MTRMLAAVLALGPILTAGAAAQVPDGLVVAQSPYPAVETIERVEQIARAGGATIFARISHSDGAANVGVELAPTELVIFGSPRMGAPVMAQSQLAGLELPIRMLAYEADGQTQLVYAAPTAMAERMGADPNSEAVQRMQTTLTRLATRAVSTGALDQAEENGDE